MQSRNLANAPPTICSLYGLRESQDLIEAGPSPERRIVTKYSGLEGPLTGWVDIRARFWLEDKSMPRSLNAGVILTGCDGAGKHFAIPSAGEASSKRAHLAVRSSGKS
jgi:hypothetical protein